MIRAVVLDFDGVILDSVGIKTNAFARLFEDKGPAVVQRVVDYHLAHGGVSRFRKFAHIYSNILGQPLSDMESAQLGNHFTALVFDEVLKASWITGALDFLRANHQRYLLFLASGTPEEELRQIVDQRELAKYFAGVLGSPASKTKIIDRILQQNNLKKAELVFVGDAITDFEAAAQSGVVFIGIAPANKSPFPNGTTVLPDLCKLEGTLVTMSAKP